MSLWFRMIILKKLPRLSAKRKRQSLLFWSELGTILHTKGSTTEVHSLSQDHVNVACTERTTLLVVLVACIMTRNWFFIMWAGQQSQCHRCLSESDSFRFILSTENLKSHMLQTLGRKLLWTQWINPFGKKQFSGHMHKAEKDGTNHSSHSSPVSCPVGPQNQHWDFSLFLFCGQHCIFCSLGIEYGIWSVLWLFGWQLHLIPAFTCTTVHLFTHELSM